MRRRNFQSASSLSVHGNRFDAEVCDWLKVQPDVRFPYLSQPSLPGAILKGRELVTTEFFSMLDDDDEYLPNATDKKLAVLKMDAQADLVVGNYYRYSASGQTLGYSGLHDVPSKPLEILMEFNWLLSGNSLFRTDSVGLKYFADYHPYAGMDFHGIPPYLG